MDHLEFKAALNTNDAGLIIGMAWPFGSADRVGDVIEKGAFAGASAPMPMLFAHNPEAVVGVWNRIEERPDGLHVEGKLLIDDVARAREVHAMVRSGAVRALSIGFQTKQAVARKGGGRVIKLLDLAEVSLVSVGMHPGARVTSAKGTAAAAIAIAAAIHRAAAALKTPRGK